MTLTFDCNVKSEIQKPLYHLKTFTNIQEATTVTNIKSPKLMLNELKVIKQIFKMLTPGSYQE